VFAVCWDIVRSQNLSFSSPVASNLMVDGVGAAIKCENENLYNMQNKSICSGVTKRSSGFSGQSVGAGLSITGRRELEASAPSTPDKFSLTGTLVLNPTIEVCWSIHHRLLRHDCSDQRLF